MLMRIMNRATTFCSAILILLSSCQPDNDQLSRFPSEEVVANRMDPLLKSSDLPSLVAMAINKQGEEITYTYGNAIWTEDLPVSTNSIFRIASMTKLVTSVAALQLVESGAIQLDDDLSELLPEMSTIPILNDEGEFFEGRNPITLRNLLTHSSGFGYTSTDSLLSRQDFSDWKYEDLPRRFESGTQFLYGTSTVWVGRVVEKLSGLNLEDYFRKNVTGPLGMDRTWYNLPEELHDDIVSFGNRGDEGTGELREYPDRIPKEKVEIYYGGGGLFTSPSDYSKLLSCLLNDGRYQETRILKKETVDQLFKPQFQNVSMDIKDNYYGKARCCNFIGLIKPTANHGLAGVIDMESTSYGRKEGTLFWGGVYNTYWYIDRKSGVAATIYTQHVPFNHPITTSIFDKFSEIVYEKYR